MLKHPSTRSLTGVILAGFLLSLFGAGTAAAQGFRAFVLRNNALISLNTVNPAGTASAPIPITGLTVGDTLVGIDFRPQNGMLYGLGFNSGAGTVQLYAISYRTGAATVVGATGAFVDALGDPAPIQGTAFGFDFNPAADRLRVVTNAGQNFRINPNTGVFIDGDLGGPAASVPGLNMDGVQNGSAAEVAAAAYTNDEQNATATTLYTLLAVGNTLQIQNPANFGTQTMATVVKLNGSTLTFTAANGFDIPPGVDVLTSNTVSTGAGIAALTVGGVSSLYSINLSTAVATLLGPIGDGTVAIQGFAIQGVPVPGGLPSIALAATNLLRFNTATPTTAVTVAVTGLVAGEVLQGIDWRPQTGQLYGLGFNSVAESATLYRLDPQTGAATIIGVAGGIANGAGTPISLAGATSFGFDFNPTVDRIRVVTNNGINFRVNPNTAAIVGLDTPINGLPGGSTGVTGAAYTNSYGHDLAAGAPTTLYTLDPSSNMLFIQNPPNNGLETSGLNVTLGISTTVLDFGAINGFDIPPAVQVSTSNTVATGEAYAVLTVSGATNLYRLQLATGAATLVGAVGGSTVQVLTGLAVGDGLLPTATTLSSSGNPASVNQLVTFNAVVDLLNAATGTITFTNGGSPIPGCAAMSGIMGVAMCPMMFGAVGSYPIVATYSGDGDHAPSAGTLTEQVNVGFTATTTTVSANPNPAQLGQSVIFVANVVAPDNPINARGTVTFQVDGTPIGTAALANGTAVFSKSDVPAGTHTVTASFGGDLGFAPSTSPAVPLIVAAPGLFTQYFAEGATGNFFHTDLGFFNASTTDVAHVHVTFFPEDGATVGPTPYTLNPLGRMTIDVNALLPNASGVSMLVDSDQPVAATRQMTWGAPLYGSTLESGAASPATTWYFAEGATNVFSLFYLIENANATAANVTLTHLLEGGAAPVVETEVVPAFTRRTFFINDVPGLRFAAFSTTVTSDLPIVAERAMYLNTGGRLWEGGAAGHGATALSFNWSFAEGATGFFHTYLTLGNPNVGATTVTGSYLFPSGQVITKSYVVWGQSRRTVDVAGEDPLLLSASVGMSLTSTLPIVAERAMWWGDPFTDGSASLGSTQAGTVWAIGDGAEGGVSDEAMFVLVSNTSFEQPSVRLTVAYDDGTHEEKNYMVLRNSRLTVRIGDDFPNARQHRFSVLVESTLLDPITVEYARYQSPGGVFADGGGAALATRIK